MKIDNYNIFGNKVIKLCSQKVSKLSLYFCHQKRLHLPEKKAARARPPRATPSSPHARVLKARHWISQPRHRIRSTRKGNQTPHQAPSVHLCSFGSLWRPSVERLRKEPVHLCSFGSLRSPQSSGKHGFTEK